MAFVRAPVRVLRSRSARMSAVVLTVAAVVMVASCSSDPAPSTRPAESVGPVDADRLVVIGDSITAQGRDQLLGAFADRYRVVIDGRPGETVTELQGPAEQLSDPPPSVVIVELGTNDIMYGREVTTSVRDLRRLVDTFARSACVVVVTVDEGLPRADALERARILNTGIREIAAADPQRIRIVDMNAVIAAAEADPTMPEPFHYDGVHPSDAGQSRLAAAYSDAVASCGG